MLKMVRFMEFSFQTLTAGLSSVFNLGRYNILAFCLSRGAGTSILIKLMELRLSIILLSIICHAGVALAFPGPSTNDALSPATATDAVCSIASPDSDNNDSVNDNRLGFACLRAGDPKNAINFFNRAIARNPSFATAYNNLGVAYLQLKFYPQAIASFRRVLDLDDGYSRARFNLALALFRNGDYLQAVAEIKTLRRLDEQYLRRRHDREKSRAELDRAMARDPDSSILLKLWSIFESDDYLDSDGDYDIDSPPRQQ